MEINIRNPGTPSRLSIKLNSTVFLDHTCHELWGQTILQLISRRPLLLWNIEATNTSGIKLNLVQLLPVHQKLWSEKNSKIWERNMCMLVARCGWLANSAALCLISQSFAIFHRHSWCLKKIENKISLSNFNFSSLLSKWLLGIAPYSGLNLYLVPHVPSALSWVSSPYCLSCVSCLHTFSCIVSISLFTFIFCPSPVMKINKLSNNCRAS